MTLLLYVLTQPEGMFDSRFNYTALWKLRPQKHEQFEDRLRTRTNEASSTVCDLARFRLNPEVTRLGRHDWCLRSRPDDRFGFCSIRITATGSCIPTEVLF